MAPASVPGRSARPARVWSPASSHWLPAAICTVLLLPTRWALALRRLPASSCSNGLLSWPLLLINRLPLARALLLLASTGAASKLLPWLRNCGVASAVKTWPPSSKADSVASNCGSWVAGALSARCSVPASCNLATVSSAPRRRLAGAATTSVPTPARLCAALVVRLPACRVSRGVPSVPAAPRSSVPPDSVACSLASTPAFRLLAPWLLRLRLRSGAASTPLLKLAAPLKSRLPLPPARPDTVPARPRLAAVSAAASCRWPPAATCSAAPLPRLPALPLVSVAPLLIWMVGDCSRPPASRVRLPAATVLLPATRTGAARRLMPWLLRLPVLSGLATRPLSSAVNPVMVSRPAPARLPCSASDATVAGLASCKVPPAATCTTVSADKALPPTLSSTPWSTCSKPPPTAVPPS